MQALACIPYLLLGLFQLVATIAGIEHWLGIHWFFAGIIAIFVASIPVIGTVLGMVGAHYAWGWSWPSAFLLFFGPLIVAGGIALAADGLENIRARRTPMATASDPRRSFPVAEVIAIVMLLWALVPVNPYGYYIVLRFAICSISIYLGYRARELQKSIWFWLLVILAIVYNPLVRIHLTREVWSLVNVAAIVLFAWAIFALKSKEGMKGLTQGGTDGPEAP